MTDIHRLTDTHGHTQNTQTHICTRHTHMYRHTHIRKHTCHTQARTQHTHRHTCAHTQTHIATRTYVEHYVMYMHHTPKNWSSVYMHCTPIGLVSHTTVCMWQSISLYSTALGPWYNIKSVCWGGGGGGGEGGDFF